ncbi:MAG: PKD domain-containing protein [Verrucomicrobia bacterium]|nr:PKD domain-containing protein [Verrucomicrobiota bacterium]
MNTRMELKSLFVALWIVTLALVAVAPSRAQEPTAWKAGVASVKITPEGPVWMAGYAARKKPSEGVAADLFAKALAIEDPRGTRVVIVTMDLISVPRALRDWLEKQVKEKFRLPQASLLMNASHTHCGPELRISRLSDEEIKAEFIPAAEKYMARLQQQLVTLVGDALKRLAPAKLDFMRARCGFAMNRRRPTPAGYANAPNSDGLVDHEVPVLRVRDPQGKLVAVLFGYACHTTTCGDYLIRGDYAGYAQQFFEEANPGVTALFMTGCGADQNPYPRGKEELCKYHGRALAMAVEAALQTVPKPLRGPLRTAFADVTIDFAPVPPREELEKTAATGKEPYSGHAKRMLKELKEAGKIRSTYPCPVQVVRFGSDLILVAIAGETCVDYSLRLKRTLAGPAVWVAGYCNDVFAYLPSLRVLREGGYEAGGATVWGSLPGPFTETVEERVVSKILQMARAPIQSMPTAVDLRIGQQATVRMCDGKPATVKLISVEEKRDSLRKAVRGALVSVEVNGQPITLNCATYHLPVTVGGVQIDCPITKGYNEGGDHWGLDADARLRLWPAGYPWITPGTFRYPLNQRLFASHTLMANQIADGEQIKKKPIYYHWGLDFGGAERMEDVLAATDGEVVSVAGEVLEKDKYPSLVRPRADVIYLRDGRGWFYRYSHLDSIDPAVKLGAKIKLGQKIGVLGKKGASGGWSHLHFDIVAPQPSGRWGILEPYAFVWQAYHDAHPLEVLQAVARPHQLAAVGETVTLDGSRSWCRNGQTNITSYAWTFSDGKSARGAKVEWRFAKPGTYSEILKITDNAGNMDYDFAVVKVLDPSQPDQQPPGIHAAYWPTFGIKADDEVTFKVRSFYVAPDEGEEEWDFGDGTPAVRVRSDGNAQALAPDGYAITTHRYRDAGHYLVKVSRANRRGETATARLHVLVAPR